jgi:hypothetical protein
MLSYTGVASPAIGVFTPTTAKFWYEKVAVSKTEIATLPTV